MVFCPGITLGYSHHDVGTSVAHLKLCHGNVLALAWRLTRVSRTLACMGYSHLVSPGGVTLPFRNKASFHTLNSSNIFSPPYAGWHQELSNITTFDNLGYKRRPTSFELHSLNIKTLSTSSSLASCSNFPPF